MMKVASLGDVVHGGGPAVFRDEPDQTDESNEVRIRCFGNEHLSPKFEPEFNGTYQLYLNALPASSVRHRSPQR